MALGTLGKIDTHDTWYADVTYDMASVNTVSVADRAITVPGVLYGVDECIRVLPPVALDYGLSVQNAHVSADDTVTVRVTNTTGGGIDAASGTWRFIIGRFGRA